MKKFWNCPAVLPKLEKVWKNGNKSWVLFKAATNEMLYKWKFFFILVKSYIISPLRLQCIVKKDLFLRFLRSVLITCLITLSLEKEFIVLERCLEVLNFGSENLYKPWNPDNLGLKVEPLGLFSFFQQFAWWAISNISLLKEKFIYEPRFVLAPQKPWTSWLKEHLTLSCLLFYFLVWK